MTQLVSSFNSVSVILSQFGKGNNKRLYAESKQVIFRGKNMHSKSSFDLDIQVKVIKSITRLTAERVQLGGRQDNSTRGLMMT